MELDDFSVLFRIDGRSVFVFFNILFLFRKKTIFMSNLNDINCGDGTLILVAQIVQFFFIHFYDFE